MTIIELNRKQTTFRNKVSKDNVNLKDSLDTLSDLQDEAEETKVSFLVLLSNYESKKETVNNTSNNNHVKLPDLPLPTFSGKFQEFEQFKLQFMNLIGNNPSLNEVKKLCYLKGVLKNEASLIQSDQDTFDSLMKALEVRKRLCDVVKLTLKSKDSPNLKIDLDALVTDNISATNIPPPELDNIPQAVQLENLVLADSPDCQDPITILIGADYYYDVVTGKIKHLSKKLFAVETIFGWCLQSRNSENQSSLALSVIVQENLISDQLKKFWDL
ncbi:uncharacterized protein TNIN_196091 [Trichonephila inaurata madagascariensis]|uniref:Peptidase aspartic putative domain-containing protein n=1 Tax=Trichonephila inaurata madagascariensis TaxID=2747483 RepID=A0A8X6WU33_9ARAC|nr:uncharacterized protein TNIN_196091 [Trichonephila inaurata madagascariensis]